MINFQFGGFYFHRSLRIQLTKKINPSKHELNDYLSFFANNNGTLGLRNDQEENFKPFEMTLYSDDKRYLITFCRWSEDDELDIRTFNDLSGSQEFISMLGEPYAKVSTVTDFSLVRKAFIEFHETGDVSEILLI